MRVDWVTRRIGDVCSLTTGGTPSRSNPAFFGGDIKWLVSGDIHKGEIFDCDGRITEAGMRASNARILPLNSVMIALNGQGKTRGTVSILRILATCNQSLVSISPNDQSELLSEYLYVNLHGRYQEIRRITGDDGKDRRGLNMDLIRNIEIPIPPISDQRRIVGILSEAFAGLASAKDCAERNHRSARAIFESHLQSVFIQRGEGWTEMMIGDVCTLKSGTTVPVEVERTHGKIPYVKVAEMTLPENRDGITTSIRFLDEHDVKPSWVIPAGATIFPKRGGAILTNKKRLALVDMCADLNIMSAIPSDRITSEFLYFYFLTVDMRKIGSGSSIPQINNYDIAPLLISFPNAKSKQLEVTANFRALEKECQTLSSIYERKLSELEALKGSLLHLAFSGNL